MILLSIRWTQWLLQISETNRLASNNLINSNTSKYFYQKYVPLFWFNQSPNKNMRTISFPWNRLVLLQENCPSKFLKKIERKPIKPLSFFATWLSLNNKTSKLEWTKAQSVTLQAGDLHQFDFIFLLSIWSNTWTDVNYY